MNLRYLAGRACDQALHALLSARWLPLVRAVPVGLSWPYDLQRFAGTRRLPTLIDAGANIGQTARLLARYFPDAGIHSFEPVQATFRRLEAATARHRNIRCVPAALGAAAGRVTIDLREDSEMNSLVPTETGAAPAGRRETVAVETLDDYCARGGLAFVDVLKLDVQGFELEVLRGAARLLAQKRIGFVYAEVAFAGADREMQPFGSLDAFLQEQGFTLSGFYEPFRWGPTRQFLGFCNALYLCPAALATRPGAALPLPESTAPAT